MKRMGWFRKGGLGIGMLLAGAGIWVLTQGIPVMAADPSAELKTAITHAGYSAKAETKAASRAVTAVLDTVAKAQ